ncbi:hypothetical protein SCHPADRAFT_898784 [Schizopora paradoxa]|uniref:Mmc1 C-terminal domain-containing protein n=1 Tax=Schizopora paradoxa TaxID=27342 RepID=A0A0H2S6E8_9AGAM|nr:hypothetical protein SCHPADRAFT_898784 [Schizopora paradoxa]
MSPALWSAIGAINSPQTYKQFSVRLRLLLQASARRRVPQSRRRHGDHARPYASSTNGGSLVKHDYNDVLEEAAGTLLKLSSRGKGPDIDVQLVEGLIRAKERLQEGTSTPRVSVFSVNDEISSSSSSQDLVSAFLEDPLSEDVERRKCIRDRWKDTTESGSTLEFEFGPTLETDGTRTRFPSPRLSQIPILLTEQLAPQDPTETLTADVPILVLSPLQRTDIPWTRIPVTNPHFLILVNATATDKTVLEAQDYIQSKLDGNAPRVLFVDATRALKAFDALRSDPTSSKAIQAYQDDFNGSNFHSFLQKLSESISEGPEKLRRDTRRALASNLLQTSRDLLHAYQKDVHEVRCAVSTLRESYLETREGAQRDVLGSDVAEETLVTEAIERAGKDVKPTLDNLKWWKLLVVVDDITQVVSGAAEKAYTKQFKDNLVFHSGRLSASQASFVDKTEDMLRTLPVAFRSPVLQNSLLQHSAHPSFAVTPATLLAPLQSRLSQLTFATNRLHRAAQRLLLTTFSSSALSTVSGYGLWLGAYLDGTTAFGGAALLATLALRCTVGRWERAKRSWWQDWTRVGQGLGRDLRTSLESTLDNQVFVVPESACEGLDKLVETRREELVALKEDVSRLSSELREIEKSNEEK